MGGGAPSDKNLGQAVTKCRNVGSGLNQIQLRVALAGDSKLLGKVMQHNKPEELHDILIAASKRLRIQPTLPISRPTVVDGAAQTTSGRARSVPPVSGRGGKGAVRASSASAKVRFMDTDRPRDGGSKGSGAGKGRGVSNATSTPNEAAKPGAMRNGVSKDPPPVFELVQEGWSVPIVTFEADLEKPTKGGVCLIDSLDQAKQLAELLPKTEGAALACAAPYKMPLAAHASVALTVSLVRKHKGVETRLFANSHLFQLSSQSVSYKPHKEAVAAKIDDKEATIVLPVRVDPSLASSDLQTESKHTLVRTLLDVAMNGKAEQSIIDHVWSVRDADKELSALVRVKKGAVSDFLRVSGSQGTWVDSPREMRNDQDLIWLRDARGENDTLESAHDRKSKIQDCLGLIKRVQGAKTSYALRVPRGRAQAVKQTLGMPTEDA